MGPMLTLSLHQPVKCGYCGWFVGALLNTSLSRHKCFELYNDETQLIHIDDNNIVTIVEKVQSSMIDSEDYNECLIAAVQARPALYDNRIPVKERSSLIKKALWKEVLNVLGVNPEEKGNVELVQKRWKQLRDSYVKTKSKEYIPSGSAASSSAKISKKNFGFYNQMKFLDDVVGKSSTISSLPDKNIDEDSAIEDPVQVAQPETSYAVIEHTASDVSPSTSQQQPNVFLSPSQQQPNVSLSPSQQQPNVSLSPNQQQSKAKKSRNCNNISDVKEVILSALEGESKKNPDAIDGFFLQIEDRVRALPARERAQFQMQVLTLLFDFEQKLSLF